MCAQININIIAFITLLYTLLLVLLLFWAEKREVLGSIPGCGQEGTEDCRKVPAGSRGEARTASEHCPGTLEQGTKCWECALQ